MHEGVLKKCSLQDRRAASDISNGKAQRCAAHAAYCTGIVHMYTRCLQIRRYIFNYRKNFKHGKRPNILALLQF
jgi:hypothetical protein